MTDPQVSAALRTQRLGAYAVVLRTDERGTEHLLLTRISGVGYPPGWWALPGGGVDHGEPPGETVVRELHEETGLTATSTRLVEVHDLHVVEHGRGDQYEDFHGVHLVYAVDLRGPGLPRPEVVDVGGTTDLAQWVPVTEVSNEGLGPLLAVVEHVVGRLDDYRSASASASSGSIGPPAPGPVDPSGV